MDELITKHAAIMDKTDPEKRIGLAIDEWGTWYDVEPGTEPGFLYQQSTMRDALVAALNFHIFHRHADRVVMTNIAQTVNVLQAMILTDKEKMIRTPTYWVFEMFKVHQGGTVLPVELQSPDYVFGSETDPGGQRLGHEGRGRQDRAPLARQQPSRTAGDASPSRWRASRRRRPRAGC